MQTHHFNLHIIFRPSEALHGQWIAHCLDFDVVSQGNSLPHALEMIREAVEMVLIDDLRAGRDPNARRAPEEEWGHMWEELKSADVRSVKVESMDEIAALNPKFVVTEPVVTIALFTAQDLAMARLARPGTESGPFQFDVPVAFAPVAHAC